MLNSYMKCGVLVLKGKPSGHFLSKGSSKIVFSCRKNSKERSANTSPGKVKMSTRTPPNSVYRLYTERPDPLSHWKLATRFEQQ